MSSAWYRSFFSGVNGLIDQNIFIKCFPLAWRVLYIWVVKFLFFCANAYTPMFPLVSTSLGYDLTPNRSQVSSWTNGDKIRWRIYVS